MLPTLSPILYFLFVESDDDGTVVQLHTSSEGSVTLRSQSAFNIGQLSAWLGRTCKGALSAVLKGWVKQEIVIQFKLAIPVVSKSAKYSMLTNKMQ